MIVHRHIGGLAFGFVDPISLLVGGAGAILGPIASIFTEPQRTQQAQIGRDAVQINAEGQIGTARIHEEETVLSGGEKTKQILILAGGAVVAVTLLSLMSGGKKSGPILVIPSAAPAPATAGFGKHKRRKRRKSR